MKHEKLINDIDEQIMKNRVNKRFITVVSVMEDNIRENNNLLGRIKTALKNADKEYERGCENAWELARKITNAVSNDGLGTGRRNEIFGTYHGSDILHNYIYKEALAKVEAYEKKQKEEAERPIVGDVVIFTNKSTGMVHRGVIRDHDDLCWYILTADYLHVIGLNKSEWVAEKTGKHVDIQGMLDVLKE